ncbi:MAG: M56 family metallopeptidase [Solirubrobacteraceae bacterium]
MSSIVLCVPLGAAACFGLAGPAAARRLPPRQATWLLSGGATLVALSSLAVLVLLGAVLVGQQSEIAHAGHWSAAALSAYAPVNRAAGAGALLAALALTATATRVGWRRGLALVSLHRNSRGLPATTGELVVVSGPPAGAYAVPGRPGCVVISQSLLATLSARERRAVLEHERAHLAHGHHWHLTAVTLAVALNPMLFSLRASAQYAVERWADETAADAIGDRRVVAAALARAALLDAPAPPTALTMASHAVPERVTALLHAPPRPRPSVLIVTGLLLLAAMTAVVISTKQVEHLFELARHLARATPLS